MEVISRRRLLATALGAAAIPSPVVAQVGKVHRVGILTLISAPSYEEVFRRTLRDRGYVEGANLVLDWRRAQGRAERLPELAQELVAERMNVIVTVSNDAALAAKAATTTIPIVMASVGNPEQRGLVASLSRPGANVTGLTLDAGPEIAGKMLEILKEAAPKISQVAILTVADSGLPLWTEHANTAARALRLSVQHFVIKNSGDMIEVLAEVRQKNHDALMATSSALIFSIRRQVLDFAARHRLPGVFPFRAYADEGGLLAYGVELNDMFRRAAVYVDKILKGAKPGDLPVEQPTRFELVVNLKTARALGLAIPQSLLLRVDQVIE